VSAATPATAEPPIYTPNPGAAPWSRMLLAQTLIEIKLTLRRGESVLLTLLIPVGLLVFFTKVKLLDDEAIGRPIDFVAPGVLALAVLSTAFTGQAIATGFERSYGVLKRLGASPLPRGVLLLGKTLGVLAVEVLQIVVLVAVAYALDWHPHGNPLTVLLLLVVGTAAFSALGLLMAGALRAEATLAAANGVYLVFLLLGGIVFPLTRLPGALQAFAKVLPGTGLSTGLREVLQHGAGVPWGDVGLLALWAVVAGVLAARTFRWE
jgi:ABC-2 type transport system permease protein